MAEEDGFLARWSRRKALTRGVGSRADEVAPAGAAPVEEHGDNGAVTGRGKDAGAGPLSSAPPGARQVPNDVVPVPDDAVPLPHDAVPLPTLDDVARLTPQSDFSRFVARAVAPEVKNAALKKLFTDPHFNVMDGLDIYIDDYGKPAPIPLSMLRQMAQAKVLGLFDDDEPENDGGPEQPVGQVVSETIRPAVSDAAGQTLPEPIVQAGSETAEEAPAPEAADIRAAAVATAPATAVGAREGTGGDGIGGDAPREASPGPGGDVKHHG